MFQLEARRTGSGSGRNACGRVAVRGQPRSVPAVNLKSSSLARLHSRGIQYRNELNCISMQAEEWSQENGTESGATMTVI